MQRRQLLIALAGALVVACTGAPPATAPDPEVPLSDDSVFHRIYRDPALRERFLPFLVNVFSLFPPDKLHALIEEAARTHGSDPEIYRAVAAGLPGIRPRGSLLTHALPALRTQKQTMAEQAARLLGEGSTIDGYLEMGTTGRYLNSLGRRITVEGPVFVLNDLAPTHSPVDIVERGQIAKHGVFVHLSDYAPVPETVPDSSVDLVSNLIGFHHCPQAALEPFLGSLRRILRPGGRLLLREHDVTDPVMEAIAILAHEVFNAGTGLSVEDNAQEIRAFRSVEAWEELLAAQGFRRQPGAELQEGDPTLNTLLIFERE